MQIYLHKKSLNFTDYSKVVDRRQRAVPTFLNYYSRHHKDGWDQEMGGIAGQLCVLMFRSLSLDSK